MKTLTLILAAASAVALSSCAETYYTGEGPPHEGGPVVVEPGPVVVERHQRRVDFEEPPRVVEHYSERRYPAQSYSEPSYPAKSDPDTYPELRPYYGDPVPGTTIQRTTTRNYQGY